MPTRHPRIRIRHPRARGFTLIEAALTTVIVGTGVLAIVAAQQAYHRKNNWAQRTGTAMLLANELRELMVHMPLRDPQTRGTVGPEEGVSDEALQLWDDVDDFAVNRSNPYIGRHTFSPPINAMRLRLDGDEMARWSQHVEVQAADPDYPANPWYAVDLSDFATVQMMRVTVRVEYDGEEVATLSWLATN